MWREETRASPGLLLLSDGLLGEKLDLNRLLEMTEKREAFAGAAVLQVRWCWCRSGWRRLILQTERMELEFLNPFLSSAAPVQLGSYMMVFILLQHVLVINPVMII